MVAITGQVPTTAIGTDAFQECDTVGITRSVTKHNELVMSAEDLPRVIREAFHIATTGRPGPVLVDVPKDVLQTTMDWYWPDGVDLPGYKPTTKGHPRMIREAAKLILASERPVIYVGGGILKARAAEALRELAELTDIHVVTTLMARGAFPDSHPLCLGMPGMHGNATAVTAHAEGRPADRPRRPLRRPRHRQGARRSPPRPRSSTSTSTRPSRARCAGPTCPIVGDCRLVIEELVREIRHLLAGGADAGRHQRVAESRISRLAGAVPAHLRAVASRARRSSRSSASRCCATRRPRARSWCRAWASTRCGRRSTGTSRSPTRG